MAETTAPAKAEPTAKPARREPFDMFEAFQEEMERFMNRAWPWTMMRPFRRPAAATAWAPKVDVFEKNGSLVVKAELPGIKKEDVQVTLDRGDLEVQGERKTETEVKEEDYYRMERSYGSFYRRLPLPFEVKPEQITANFADGVLEITIPKPAEEKPAAQKITVG